MLCKRKEELRGNRWGSLLLSIILFYYPIFPFSRTRIKFSLFPSFLGQYHPVWANLPGKSFLWWRLSFAPLSMTIFVYILIFDIL